jgi:PEP-CTERM motif
MKFKTIVTAASSVAGSVLAFSGTPAYAFSFTTNLGAGSNAPKGDISLDSVQLSDGTSINNFVLVNQATILQNDLHTGGNTGAASADRGDNVSVGVKAENPTNADIVANLGNLNLNTIIDTEDTGSFKMNIGFEQSLTHLFFWERGKNSFLGIQVLDDTDTPIGNFLNLDFTTANSAGYAIDTTEINGKHSVSSIGVNLSDLGVSAPIRRIQLTARGAASNGPDFKVVGASVEDKESVPEPASLAGLGLIAGLGFLVRRQRGDR